ncbi:MAG: glycosyltransferase family 1 protein [Roseobacter sp.]|uniref:glycosyltransferase family 4 protein n=1 Tax=Tateyamaria sp. TaxID=1929288 RepID=UPI0032958B68
MDRVELAYVRTLIADDIPMFGLIRSRIGYILLDQAGVELMVPLLSGPVSNETVEAQQRHSWRHAREHAIGRVPPFLLRAMLRRKLPTGFAYLNVGHSNLTDRVLGAMRSLDVRITTFIHDVIPLDFPEFQRDGTVQPFADMIARVGKFADLVIYNSKDTQARAQAHLPSGSTSIVSYLGTDEVDSKVTDIPNGVPRDTPFFVCIGTIEPRKNHAFLLDLWDQMGTQAPGLIIAGGRGWKNEEVFARLDALSAGGPVYEVSGLSDGALAALMDRAAGVLFPSLAEGFGLPATEAAARGIPLIANDLPVLREILGDIPIYASVSDRYLWLNKINELASLGPNAPDQQQYVPPTWDAHFKTVLRLT